MTTIIVEILLIVLLIITNGVFAMAEIAIISARKARLRQRADDGDAGAQATLALANAPNCFLSTVQIGITLIGILAGAFSGATIAEQLGASLSRIPLLAPYGEAIGIGVVVLAITYLSLVIGELAPKRVALGNAEPIAAALARPMRALSRVAYPAMRVLGLSTEAVLWVLGVRPSAEPPITEEEIKVLIEQGRQAGVFDEAEQYLRATRSSGQAQGCFYQTLFEGASYDHNTTHTRSKQGIDPRSEAGPDRRAFRLHDAPAVQHRGQHLPDDAHRRGDPARRRPGGGVG